MIAVHRRSQLGAEALTVAMSVPFWFPRLSDNVDSETDPVILVGCHSADAPCMPCSRSLRRWDGPTDAQTQREEDRHGPRCEERLPTRLQPPVCRDSGVVIQSPSTQERALLWRSQSDLSTADHAARSARGRCGRSGAWCCDPAL
ncbi:hypothetical protein SKAU_G00049910 [Synaphobranchus kaupii]|uniref:Uncharacterized protein n=1 Tax=Synaphobranchus kaupii TaxID=118154 RepID=A0A9Q1G382_SYNKA|nr:hypothetical protein SKAU_G00049910 [Synaphobranchus kaupii]